jgi:hypothetical protein
MMLVPFHTDSTLQRANVPRYQTSVKHRCPPSDVEHARRSVLISRCGRHRSSLEGENCTLLPQIVGDDAVNHGNAEWGCRKMTRKQDAERPARCERPESRSLNGALSSCFDRSKCLADVCLLACDAFVLFRLSFDPSPTPVRGGSLVQLPLE